MSSTTTNHFHLDTEIRWTCTDAQTLPGGDRSLQSQVAILQDCFWMQSMCASACVSGFPHNKNHRSFPNCKITRMFCQPPQIWRRALIPFHMVAASLRTLASGWLANIVRGTWYRCCQLVMLPACLPASFNLRVPVEVATCDMHLRVLSSASMSPLSTVKRESELEAGRPVSMISHPVDLDEGQQL